MAVVRRDEEWAATAMAGELVVASWSRASAIYWQ